MDENPNVAPLEEKKNKNIEFQFSVFRMFRVVRERLTWFTCNCPECLSITLDDWDLDDR